MSVDELIPRAREIVREKGAVPSKDALMRAFRIGRPKAMEIHDRLTVEVAQRRTQGRRVLRRIAARKGGGRLLQPRPRPLLAVPMSPVVGPAVPVEDPQVAVIEPTPPVELASPFQPPSEPVRRPVRSWPLLLLAAPAFVAIWSGWVDLGRLTGFGVVHPFPGIFDEVSLNTAITLPIGLETYAAYALYVWLSGAVPAAARRFAKWSAIGSLALGAAGQVAYHLMISYGMTHAPWQITTVVACLPVAVLGMGAALRHLVRAGEAS